VRTASQDVTPLHAGMDAPGDARTAPAWTVAKRPSRAESVAETLADAAVVLAHCDLGYLICADALDRSAVDRAVRLRGGRRGLAVLVDPDQADRYAVIGRRARRLMLETWPGTLALRLPRRRSLPAWAASGDAATLVCPDAFHLEVARTFGSPLVVLAARGPADGRAATICPRLAREVDLVVDGGEAVCARPTVLDLTSVRPRVASSGGMFAQQRLRRLVPDL
jgi:tRNA A37 threonylcarbamoyladenosine synthetase subunit TsaC/SUA5/YrdC